MADVIMGDRDLGLAFRFYLPGKFRLKVELRGLKAGKCLLHYFVSRSALALFLPCASRRLSPSSLLLGQRVCHPSVSCSLLASLGAPGSQVLARVPLSGLAPTALGKSARTQWPPQGDTPFLFVGSWGQPM